MTEFRGHYVFNKSEHGAQKVGYQEVERSSVEDAILDGDVLRDSGIVDDDGIIRISVGDGQDVETIQEAVDLIPQLPAHRGLINVYSDDYSHTDEDVKIGPSWGGRRRDNNSFTLFNVKGAPNDPSQVQVNSIQVDNVSGAVPLYLRGFEVAGSNPDSDEDGKITVYGGGNVAILDCVFTDANEAASKGIVAYNSSVTINNLDYGTDILNRAVDCKKGGRVQEARDATSTGQAETAYAVTSGRILINDASNLTATGDYVRTASDDGDFQGWVMNTDTGRTWGLASNTSAQKELSDDYTALAADGYQVVPFDTTVSNSSDMDTGGSGNALIVNENGEYSVSYSMEVSGSAGDTVTVQLQGAGGGAWDTRMTHTLAGATDTISDSFDAIPLAKGDDIRVRVNPSADVTITGGSTGSKFGAKQV